MKDQDGSIDIQRDVTFLAESGMLPKVRIPAYLHAAASFSLKANFDVLCLVSIFVWQRLPPLSCCYNVMQQPLSMKSHNSLCCAFLQAEADKMASSSTAARLASTCRDQDIPVSIYSEAALKGQYGSTVYGSRITGAAAFAKNSDFSKPLSEYSKIMDADCVPMAAEA